MSGGAPVLRIIRGIPADTDASIEVAALVAVLLARDDQHPGPSQPTRWAARDGLVRRPLAPGPDGWWASGRPG